MRREYKRRIPRLPNRPVRHDPPDSGAPLPAPQPGYEYRNTAPRYATPAIVAVAKPPYAERSGKWQRS